MVLFSQNFNPRLTLSTNFLIIAPYVIVLERLQKDFDNNSIFNLDPLIPENDYDGIRWKDFFKFKFIFRIR